MANAYEAANVVLISTAIGLALFLTLHFWSRKTELHAGFLTVFFGANLLNLLDDLYWEFEVWKTVPQLVNVYIPSLYLLAPSLYLYIKAISNNEFNNSRRYKNTHYLGFALAVLACLPYFVFDSELKLARLLATPESRTHLHIITLGPTVALITVLPFSLFYLILCINALSTHLNSIKSYFSNIENRQLSWIRWSLFILGANLIVSVFSLLLPNDMLEPHLKLGFQTFEFVWLLIFGLLAVRQTPIFNDSENITNTANTKQNRYARSRISDIETKQLTKKMLAVMQSEKLYLDPDLTLRKLSEKTGISENNLSQLLNLEVKLGFYDFVNKWRIDEACVVIRESRKNLLEIAYQVGFNSRSTFNLAFKKHKGMSPSQYRKQEPQ